MKRKSTSPSLRKIKTLDGIKLEKGKKDYRTQYRTWIKRKNKITKIRETAYKKSKGRCVYCNTKLDFDEMTLDHLTPLNRNGTNKSSNFVCSCSECNMDKGDLTLREFYFIRWVIKKGYNKNIFKSMSRFSCVNTGIRYFLKRIDDPKYFWFNLKFKLLTKLKMKLLYGV